MKYLDEHNYMLGNVDQFFEKRLSLVVRRCVPGGKTKCADSTKIDEIIKKLRITVVNSQTLQESSPTDLAAVY